MHLDAMTKLVRATLIVVALSSLDQTQAGSGFV